MQIERFSSGPLDTNGYVVVQDGEAVVIDPSLQPEALLRYIEQESLRVTAILLTHGHFDHYMGVYPLFDSLGNLPVWLHRGDAELIANPALNLSHWVTTPDGFTGETVPYIEGENRCGGFTFEVIHTPGHTPGGVSLLFGNDCFTGDTLFNGAVGRSDFPYSSTDQLISGIMDSLCTLPEETVIWPGHGGASTIGTEKSQNPYLR